jgi:Family of unknown function (DUF6172)
MTPFPFFASFARPTRYLLSSTLFRFLLRPATHYPLLATRYCLRHPIPSAQMKKTFPFHAPGKDDARVLEAIKGDIRKYLKRERRKKFPEGHDLWDFNCKIGPDQATASVVTVADLIPALDKLAAAEGAKQVYVEILAFASNRQPARVSPFDQPEPDAPAPVSENPPATL